MAERALVVNRSLALGAPPRIVADEDGKLSPQVIEDLQRYLESVQAHVNNITIGKGGQSAKAGHLKAQLVEFTAPSTPDQQFTIDHGLGSTPTMVFVGRSDRAGELYDANAGGWGPKKIYFKSTTGSKVYTIMIWG